MRGKRRRGGGLALAPLCLAVLVPGRAALAERVWVDPPPRPSGGSGVEGVREGPRWIEVPGGLAAAVPTREGVGPAAPGAAAIASTPLPRRAFDGVVDSPSVTVPPDTHIAAGPGLRESGRIVMVTNARVQIWDKTGASVAGPTFLDAMFGADTFDPKVLYDQHSGRFFIVCLVQYDGPPRVSEIHVAVSSDGTPDDLGPSWTFLSGSALTTLGGKDTWADYPGIGADASALFVTTNQFDFAPGFFRGIKIRVFDKAQLMAGVYAFVDLDIDDAVTTVSTTQPAHVFGATDNGGFYLVSRIDASFYRLFHVSGHPGAPVETNGLFPWSGGTFPPDDGADQCTVGNPDLDTLAPRVQNAVHRDGHIWLALTADPDDDGETEVVWQDIEPNAYPSGSPSVFQSGYLDGSGAGVWTYMPSISVNPDGDAAIVYTQSSAAECPTVRYASRSPGDAPGSFRTAVLARTSDGYYDSFSASNPDRWGDYAATVIDPDDGCFWMAQEFVFASIPADSEWGTHVVNVCTSPPLVPLMEGWGAAALALLLLGSGAAGLRRGPVTSRRDP
jgi:hypothetical protein